jgi:plasmid maintenance system antidote protein VapI
MQTDLMDYKQAAEIIKEFNIPRSIVARLAGLHLPDLSAWLNGKQDISDDKRERVSQWVADVAKMVQAMATLSIKVDLNDVENVRHLVQKINDAEMQMGQEPSPRKPIESGTAAA